METNVKRVVLQGSERSVMTGAQAVGTVPEDERFEITVRLRAKKALEPRSTTNVEADVLPKQRHYLTREELAAQHGADPQDLARLTSFAHDYGLVVVESSLERRSVVLSGMAGDFSKAFGTKFEHYEHDEGEYRGRTGGLTIPKELDGIVEGVFGLDDRPQAKPKFQHNGIHPMANNQVSYTPINLAQVYNFPSGLDGSGQCIALIELGGGYRTADLKTYFKKLGLPKPNVKSVRVDGGRNHPTTADSADGEVMLDIEVVAAVAPKARIVVYFAPNTTQGFLDAITKAVHDTVNKPTIISISWGAAESDWTVQAMQQYTQAFQAAAAVGISVFCAAGDNGSSDNVNDGLPHVDFPASSPYAVGCGGTRLVASGSKISSETVWNEGPNSATGGGVSGFFPVPTYQGSVNIPASANPKGGKGRGVPDVCGDADPATGYQVRVDGQDMVFGGTSAVAPLWAGLTALLNQKLGTPVGFINPLIYGSLAGKGLFNDITNGNNGAYSAATGWDACTGWGSPIGSKVLTALGG